MHSIFRSLRTPESPFRRLISSVGHVGKKRFYKDVFIQEAAEGKFVVQLDGKIVKTPLKNDLYATSKQLAAILASEWQFQSDQIRFDKMHITALCNTCIDNPRKKSQQEIIGELIAYLHSDTLCARIPEEESLTLAKMQMKEWDPILKWFDKRYGVKILTSSNIFGIQQSNETVDVISSHLSKLSFWQLIGLQFAVETIKSFIIPMAIVENEILIESGLRLSRLEIDVQTQKWGQVEWHHDVEYENQKASLAAGVLFYNLCNNMSWK